MQLAHKGLLREELDTVAVEGLINRCELLSTSEVGLNIVHCGWQRTTFSTGWWLQPVLKTPPPFSTGWSHQPVLKETTSLVPVRCTNRY